MKTIGIFEAKTTLPSVCAEIARTGEPVLVSRRGKPFVMISPPPPAVLNERPDIHTAWKEWTVCHGDTPDEFPEVWRMRQDRRESPFAED
ncbi:MAG: type II toxin-antitoxin system Phd/YefM family antitoxin [Opitutales bacterium]|nr:type II toxin-antitoxin system Phd/YefM family antitoxin [Opitutales bacterium]